MAGWNNVLPVQTVFEREPGALGVLLRMLWADSRSETSPQRVGCGPARDLPGRIVHSARQPPGSAQGSLPLATSLLVRSRWLLFFVFEPVYPKKVWVDPKKVFEPVDPKKGLGRSTPAINLRPREEKLPLERFGATFYPPRGRVIFFRLADPRIGDGYTKLSLTPTGVPDES